jgi:hypothetical protein
MVDFPLAVLDIDGDRRAPRLPSPECLQDCGGIQGTVGDSRGLEGATHSTENRALATEVARHRSFLKTLDAGSIPAAYVYLNEVDQFVERELGCQSRCCAGLAPGWPTEIKT